ncbi:MAG TPA: MFS transporter [Phycisphaerales bacterium]|nr:MFS transporter [Phycisphaerales bacterium]
MSPAAWRALLAAGAGWMLDGMDVMLYALALETIRGEFHLTPAQSGAVFSSTLIAAAIGGGLSGLFADRFGRVRMLMVSILIYSVCTALTATSRSFTELLIWRALVGLGMGGEWSAGAVLVSEMWPAKLRGRAIGLMQSGFAIGYILAALLAALVIPQWGWRPLFVVGVAPALMLVWIRRNVPEPEVWVKQAEPSRGLTGALPVLMKQPYAGRAAIATLSCTVLLCAYWGFFTWMPAYLARPAPDGAGLGILKSTGWIVATQVGAFLGYASFGFFADRFGRKLSFIAFVLGAAVVTPIYGLSARSPMTLMLVGPFMGFFGHGYFSVFGAMLAELFPSSVRATAQGLCYNGGRAVSAVAPWSIGAMSSALGLGPTLGLTSLLYIVGAGLILMLPETRGKEIE